MPAGPAAFALAALGLLALAPAAPRAQPLGADSALQEALEEADKNNWPAVLGKAGASLALRDSYEGRVLRARAYFHHAYDGESGFPRAAADARAALKLRPGDPVALHYLALSLGKQRKFPEAVEAAGQAVKAAPADASAWFLLAGLREAAGRTEDGLEALAAAARLDAKFGPALDAARRGERISVDFDGPPAAGPPAAPPRSGPRDVHPYLLLGIGFTVAAAVLLALGRERKRLW
ncbi:MAG: hypothetical protein HY553_20560 [Elusimicrobia bacterium]|nr:hypothetical protein [Elusimicrobiota bacterium]